MRAAVIALSVALAGSAHAEFMDGNRLLSRMTGDKSDQLLTIGYIMGVADILDGWGYCAPNNVTAGQLSDMVKQYLENNPAMRSKTADSIIWKVTSTQWPCATPKRNGI